MAKTGMPYSATSAAATSSCVESGFEAHSTTSAPPAFSVRARFAVSVVTWRHAEMRMPSSGRSCSKRSRIAARTGMCRSAHSTRVTPAGASPRSLTSWLGAVVAMAAGQSNEKSQKGRRSRVRAAVAVLEPDDVVQLRRRGLEHEGVFERAPPVHDSRREAERAAGADDLHVRRAPGLAHLELDAPGMDVDDLVLAPMELEAELLPGANEEHLADVVLGRRVDDLVAPRLLHP